MCKKERGFTLIEVAVTAAIIALLASIALPMAELSMQRNKEQELQAALRQIREAIDAYKQAGDEGHLLRKAGESGYPPSLKTLTEGVEDARNPDRSKSKLYFFAADSSRSDEQESGFECGADLGKAQLCFFCG